jgi:hypothetical protein
MPDKTPSPPGPKAGVVRCISTSFPKEAVIGCALVLLASLVAVLPIFFRGPSCGLDFDFHLGLWFDAHSSWQHGLFYPHWMWSANYGAGEPRYIFYPPISWMFGALLGSIFPWNAVPSIFVFSSLAATGLATRRFARMFLDEAPATLAGCAALFSGYALYNVYKRAAFSELFSGFLFPLLLLFALRDRNPAGPLWRRALDGSAWLLAIVLAASWLSSGPLGIMASYSLALVALVAAVAMRSWAPLLRAALAAVVGIGLDSFYLVPVLLEKPWANINLEITRPEGVIENRLLFSRHPLPGFTVHGIYDPMILLVTLTMFAVAIGGLYLAWKRGRVSLRKASWLALALIPPLVVFLQLPVSMPLYNFLPEFRFLQFPSRWLVALEAPMALFFAVAIWPGKAAGNDAGKGKRAVVVAVCVVVFLAGTAFSNRFLFQVCDVYEYQDSIAHYADLDRQNGGVLGEPEFDPTSHTLAATPGLPDACLVSDPLKPLDASASSQANPTALSVNSSCELAFSVQLSQPEHLHLNAVLPHAGYLVLRIRSYPAWRITANGLAATNLPQRDDGLIVVPVPQGPLNLAVDWTTTPDVLAGRWLSALSVLLFAVLAFCELRRGPARLT